MEKIIKVMDYIELKKDYSIPDYLQNKVGVVKKVNNNMVYVQIGKEIYKFHKDDITVIKKPSLSECKFYVYNYEKIQYGTLKECIEIFKERLKENNNYLAIGIETTDNALDFYNNKGISNDYLRNDNVFSLMSELKNAIKVIEKNI